MNLRIIYGVILSMSSLHICVVHGKFLEIVNMGDEARLKLAGWGVYMKVLLILLYCLKIFFTIVSLFKKFAVKVIVIRDPTI